jgi:hypothetical protein
MDDDYRIVISWDRFKEEAAVESRGMMPLFGGVEVTSRQMGIDLSFAKLFTS